MKKLKVLNADQQASNWDNKAIGLPISTLNERVHS